MTAAAPLLPTALSTAFGARYRIERELGRGGMGAVYLATDLRLDRPVAIKVLVREFAGDAALRERFLRETRTAASFSHPNIVPVHAVEEDGDALALVMGYVEGESLTARVARGGPLDVKATVRLLQDVAYALAYAHGRGVVHRDIKPDNIMIERATGRALLMDFGISRTIAAPTAAAGLTRVGEIVGTPEYMSPEQASGDRVDGRSDLYSLGLVAHFALTGASAMGGGSTQQVIVRQLTQALPPAASLRGDIPAAMAEAIDRCCAKEPSARFASAESLVDAIESARLAGPEIPVAIRLVAQELAMFVTLLMFLFVTFAVFKATSPSTGGDVGGLLPVMALVGAIVMRLLDLRRVVGRLGASGYTAADVFDGIRDVFDERAAAAAASAGEAATVAHRRRTILVAVLLIAAGLGLGRVAFAMRVMTSPGNYTLGLQAFAILFVGVACGGAGVFMIARNPARAPVADRLVRLLWLRGPGRSFIERAIRAGGGAMGTPRTVPPTAARQVTGTIEDRLARIEEKLDRLARGEAARQ